MRSRLGKIALMYDHRLPREKGAVVTQVVNTLRTFAEVYILHNDLDEDDLLKQIETSEYQLIILPWYRYVSWTRIEGFYGLTRTSGPTVAGYFCDDLLPYEVGEQVSYLRAILFDFYHLSMSEISRLIRALIQDSTRSGIRPLLSQETSIYFDHWKGGLSLGQVLDTSLSAPSIEKTDWMKRANALRFCLSAMWSLVYEEGPGRVHFGQVSRTDRSLAYFQIAAEPSCAYIRLWYSLNNWSPKDSLDSFWPDPKRILSPSQILLRYADFVRVHSFADSGEIELIAGFTDSSPSIKAFNQFHSLWIEPLDQKLATESPQEKADPRLKPLRPEALLSHETGAYKRRSKKIA